MKIPGGTLPGLSCIVVAIAVAACAPGQTGSPFAPSDATGSAASRTPAPTTVATVSDAANGITFVHPAAWVRWQPNAHDPINDGPLIYLSTDPLLATCATMPLQSPNPPDARGGTCDWPLRSLAPEGVFVDWYTTRILGPSPTSGEAIEVNGETARLRIERPGSCSAIGADETLAVLVPIGQPKPWSNIAVVVCLRGPDLATSEAQVRAMLASARVSP